MQSRLIKTATTTQHVHEAGSGPLVIFCHGFPDLGWCWRHQLEALAAAGFHAVAPDMRGYGGTDRPEGVEAYAMTQLVADIVALVHALGETSAVVVGHDFGAPVAWHCALLRPDMFRAVAALSIPFNPRREGRPPLAVYRAIARSMGKDFYILRFQDPSIEAELEADVETTLRTAFWSYDGATPAEKRGSGFLAPDATFLGAMHPPEGLPPWMSEDDLRVYVDAFAAGGFHGPVGWYRNIDRNWEQLAFVQGQRIQVPAWFMVGEHDPVRGYTGSGEAELEQWVTDLRGKVVVPGRGHWIQQEDPETVSSGLIGFLSSL